MDIYSWIKEILSLFKHLAPLSVVIAAIALLHNFHQTRAQKRSTQATSLRKTLGILGAKTYLLNWSLIGNSDTNKALLQIRELIELRIGTLPSSDDLSTLISDKKLFEGIIDKGFIDSGFTEKFQSEAVEFGKIKADIGNKIPILDVALEEVNTKLRMLFLLNTVVVFSARNKETINSLFKSDSSEESTIPLMTTLHQFLSDAAHISDKGSFSEACKFIQELSYAISNIDDNVLLSLSKKPSMHVIAWVWLWDIWKKVQEKKKINEIAKALKQNPSEEYRLLHRAFEDILQNKCKLRQRIKIMTLRANKLLEAVNGYLGIKELEKATNKFLSKYSEKKFIDIKTSLDLIKLRAIGVNDPDIDIFLATTTGIIELIQSAVDRGGNVNSSLGEILKKYREQLSNI